MQYNVDQINPFEIFLKGRNCEHIPRITTRLNSFNAVPHHIASTKALEDA